AAQAAQSVEARIPRLHAAITEVRSKATEGKSAADAEKIVRKRFRAAQDQEYRTLKGVTPQESGARAAARIGTDQLANREMGEAVTSPAATVRQESAKVISDIQ